MLVWVAQLIFSHFNYMGLINFRFKNIGILNDNITNLGNSLKHIERGTTTSRSVTFAKPFSSVPTVVLTVKATYNKNVVFALLKDVTTTGFTYSVHWFNGSTWGDASDVVSWIAIL